MKAGMRLIVGLGNPGAEYAGTYHNVGARAAEWMAHELGGAGETVVWNKHKNLFRYAETRKAAFVVPLTFMNNAGNAVKEALKKFRASPDDLAVLHDESDLAVGTYQLSAGRGSAGHKGVRSVMDALGTKDFLRARIGIRNPGERRRRKAEEFVLAAVKPKDKKTLQNVFEALLKELFEITGG